MIPFEEEFKKMFLMGIGAVATTFEKSQEMINRMVSKGELTVEQSKVLNEELKHHYQSGKGQSADVSPQGPATKQPDLLSQVDQLSPGELAALKEKIAKREEHAKD